MSRLSSALKWTALLPIVFVSLSGYAEEEPSFEEAALSENPTDCVKVLADPTEAFEMRKTMIRLAKDELLLSYYALVRDIKPMYLIALMQEAAEQRHVKVRLILDDYDSRVPKEMMKYLKLHGVQIRLFNPIKGANLKYYDRRMHDKYIVADRDLLLVGGRNLADHYFNPDLGAKGSFYDLDSLFVGPVAGDAARYFDERWSSPWVEDATIPTDVSDRDYEDFSALIAKDYQEMKSLGELSVPPTRDGLKVRACTEVSFHANNPTERGRDRTLEKLYANEIRNAQSTIEIQNPYIVLTPPLKRALKDALQRGVKVRLVTNSLRSNDMILAQSAYLNLRPKLLRWGAEIYEFTHAQTIHSKIAIFDEKRVVVGSFNLDPRSAKHNSEDFIITEDPNAVGPVRAFLEQTTALSAKLDANGMPEGYDERHPGTTFGKRLLNVLFRFTLAPLFRSRI